MKEGFRRCHDCGAVNYTQKREDVGNQFLFPFYSGERRRGLINFHSLQIALYLTLFVIVFNKVFKTVSRV